MPAPISPTRVGPACVGTDPELWFSLNPVEVLACLAVCDGCPVRVACLAGATARREMWGVWGGRVFLPRYGRPKGARLRRRLAPLERVAA